MKQTRWIVGGYLAGLGLASPQAWAGVPAEDPAFVEQVGALAPEACGGTGCWTNYLRVTDLDGDDALDIVLVNYDGFFSQGDPEPLVIYRNDGAGIFENRSTTAVNDFAGRIRQVAIGDVDGDGFVDLYAAEGGGGSDVLFMNDGTGVFTPIELALGSNAGAARFGDLDDDGDLDLFLADGYATTDTVHGHVYLNDGAGAFTELADAVPPPGPGQDPDDVDLLDIDGDFDLDIYLNAHQGNNALWLNRGDGTFEDASDRVPEQPRGLHYNPGVCDVDGDGDLDVWVDNVGPNCGGTCDEQLLINDGQGNLTDETAARVQGNPIVDDNGVACVDFDYDGDFDAVVYSLGSVERYLENDGTGHFTRVDGLFPEPVDATLWGEFGDLDGDGRLDLVTGQGEGTTEDRVYFGTTRQRVDATAPRFRAVQTVETVPPDREIVLHFAITDNAVTDEGPRLLEASAQVVTDEKSKEPLLFHASFMGGDLFRVVLPDSLAVEGTVLTVRPCAADRRSNTGCADAISITVTPEAVSDESTGSEGGSESSSGTTDGADTSSVGTAEPSTSAAADAGSSTDESGSTTAGASEAEGGCGCQTSNPSRPAASWLVGLAFVGLLRRRRRCQPDPLVVGHTCACASESTRTSS